MLLLAACNNPILRMYHMMHILDDCHKALLFLYQSVLVPFDIYDILVLHMLLVCSSLVCLFLLMYFVSFHHIFYFLVSSSVSLLEVHILLVMVVVLVFGLGFQRLCFHSHYRYLHLRTLCFFFLTFLSLFYFLHPIY